MKKETMIYMFRRGVWQSSRWFAKSSTVDGSKTNGRITIRPYTDSGDGIKIYEFNA